MVTALVVVGASLPAFAQIMPGNVTQSCQIAVLNILGNVDASNCLNTVGFATAVGKIGTNNSAVQPATDWIAGICAQGPCSNNTITAVMRNLTSGCSDELNKAGVIMTNVSAVIESVKTGYSGTRKALCLKDNTTSKLCINEDLSAVETGLNTTLTLMQVANIGKNISMFTSLPASSICTNCNKAVYNIFNQTFPFLITPIQSGIQTKCGSNFINGPMPTSIIGTAA